MFAGIVAVPTMVLLWLGNAPPPSADAAADLGAGAPRVVAAFPQHDSKIMPGPFELSIQFDRTMLAQHAILAPNDLNSDQMECIGSSGSVRQSDDRTTFLVSCNAIAGSQHTLAFGDAQSGFFKDDNSSAALPYVLSFTVAPGDIATAARTQ